MQTFYIRNRKFDDQKKTFFGRHGAVAIAVQCEHPVYNVGSKKNHTLVEVHLGGKELKLVRVHILMSCHIFTHVPTFTYPLELSHIHGCPYCIIYPSIYISSISVNENEKLYNDSSQRSIRIGPNDSSPPITLHPLTSITLLFYTE